jgi:hypothetical protein
MKHCSRSSEGSFRRSRSDVAGEAVRTAAVGDIGETPGLDRVRTPALRPVLLRAEYRRKSSAVHWRSGAIDLAVAA